MALWTLKIMISVIYSCNILKNCLSIFLKLCKCLSPWYHVQNTRTITELTAFGVTTLWIAIQVSYLWPFYNLKTISEVFLKPYKNRKQHKIKCRAHFIFTELWHLLDVNAVAGHGAVLSVLLFFMIRLLSVTDLGVPYLYAPTRQFMLGLISQKLFRPHHKTMYILVPYYKTHSATRTNPPPVHMRFNTSETIENHTPKPYILLFLMIRRIRWHQPWSGAYPQGTNGWCHWMYLIIGKTISIV